jgi:glucose-1-phosphate cytidylyltransferase
VASGAVGGTGAQPLRTVILCGGKGTRAYPVSLEVPKPLIPVGDVPILLHLMRIYAGQGFSDFVLAAGYRADLMAEFGRSLGLHAEGDRKDSEGWRVEVLDTGEETGTGGRIAGCFEATDLGSRFLATYGDGLGSVDISSLVGFHESHGGAATVTAVPLPSQYGTMEWDESGRVRRFREKPRLPDHWINAGYFVFEERALGIWQGDDLEREVLPALAEAGELFAFRHTGFWRSMDTYKDALELSALCEEGDGPWMTSRGSESWSLAPPDS